jgi:hypothetical protein
MQGGVFGAHAPSDLVVGALRKLTIAPVSAAG